MASDWNCIPHTYDVAKKNLQSYLTYEHPLKIQTVTVVESKGTKQSSKDNRSSFSSNASSRASSSISLLTEPLGSTLDGTDPLSQFARQEQELKDPLTQMATEFVSCSVEIFYVWICVLFCCCSTVYLSKKVQKRGYNCLRRR